MSLRMPVELRKEVQKWAATQAEKLTDSKAICRLVEMALAAAAAPKRPRPTKAIPIKKTRPKRSS